MIKNSLILLLFLLPLSAFPQKSLDPQPYREYRLLVGNPETEMEIIAQTGITANKIFYDAYYRGFGDKLHPKMRPVTDVAWGVFWTYMFSIWPHEFGHKARAMQLGGDFVIEKFGIPFPEARMEIPAGIDPQKEPLPCIGGHEINGLILRQAHQDFYANGFAYADELIHSFIQEVYYPFYAFVIAPANPAKAETWTNTRGDPVESILSVYKNYTGRSPLLADGSVDGELVDQYRRATFSSVFWILADPMLYTSARAFGTDMKKDHGLMRSTMIGNSTLGWIYGTQFNPSPLGYELYLYNHIRFRGRLYSLYIKNGGPYKNMGTGVRVPRAWEKDRFTLGCSFDAWNQDIYGNGGAAQADLGYGIGKNFGLLLTAGWKQEGYLLGRMVDETPWLLGGVKYFFK